MENCKSSLVGQMKYVTQVICNDKVSNNNEPINIYLVYHSIHPFVFRSIDTDLYRSWAKESFDGLVVI